MHKCLIGIGIVSLYALAALLGPLILKHSPYEVNLAQMLTKPTWSHPFGTDALGRDLLIRILYGARYSLTLTLTTMALVVSLGLLFGMISGYYGGALEHLVMGVVEIVMSIPIVIMAVVIASLVPSKMFGLSLTLTVVYTPTMVRLARSKTLTVKEASYVEAAVAIGAGAIRILKKHVLPNVLIPVISDGILRVGEAIILVAALSYVGLGVNPPTPEWGVLLREAMEYVTVAPHILFCVGSVLAGLVFGLNVLGEGVVESVMGK
ncbi:MAG: ABC transporter permease [Candidatus Hadarchaeum sp.]|uniref:ABC transporter permease n=1 Tax=Candidatus Hadarchaeum sp. TaxID=2883567 RepID=UPI0031723B3E